ncbi:MAG: HD-GYP domain-containing protein [Candidatus Lindowbacteria bacterium]|nr:HD-GYP domain-containing protein [Candidatus Lindowbacteria bacterium]
MGEIAKFADELGDGDQITRPIVLPNGNRLCDAGSQLNSDLISKIKRWGISVVYVDDAPSIVITSDTPLNIPMNQEDDIPWDEISEKSPELSKSPEEIAKEIEKKFEKSNQRVKDRSKVTPIPFVYDKDLISESKRVARQVHQQTALETRAAIRNMALGESIEADSIRHQIVSLVDGSAGNQQVLSALVSLTHFDDALLAHTVNSTVYAILIGQALGMPNNELYELAECCLLHDVGMCGVSPKIWRKKEKLSELEMLDIHKHTLYGADMLEKIPGLCFEAQIVAYQHHERWDGSGYPKEKSGDRIHEYARIVGLVDVYTAMTASRTYRDKILGYDAMKHVLSSTNSLFDPKIVKTFLSVMSLYPVGSMVELSTGSTAIVIAAHPLFPYRPQVKIKKDASGQDAGDAGDVINLVEERAICIARAIQSDSHSPEDIWKSL